MEEVKLKIKGIITISSDKTGIIYKEHNTITEDALEVVMNCLYQGNFTKQIDTIKVMGPFGQFSKGISSGIYNPLDKSISFKAVFLENDFTGTITDMELIAESFYQKAFAKKDGMSIYKDDESRIQIEWKIKIMN